MPNASSCGVSKVSVVRKRGLVLTLLTLLTVPTGVWIVGSVSQFPEFYIVKATDVIMMALLLVGSAVQQGV